MWAIKESLEKDDLRGAEDPACPVSKAGPAWQGRKHFAYSESVSGTLDSTASTVGAIRARREVALPVAFVYGF